MRFKPILILFVIFSCAAVSLSAGPTPPPLALSDFTVNSANPSFTFLGKGFAEIVAFELKKSPAVKLVDREKRNQILEEMEFGMTGLTDPAAQLEMGKLLSVRYLVGGSITDMGGTLLVSLSMVDVETGEVVWNDQVNAAGGKYAYIGAYFGKSLLKYFKASAAKSTEVALKAETEKDTASVVALSQGIAALDKGDKEAAKKELTLAKKIDPGNAVASAFLSKLAAASAKFKVVPEHYVSYYNPAYLGGIEKDRAYLNYATTWIQYGVSDPNNGGLDVANPSGMYGARELQKSTDFGYATPLSPRVGIGVDFITNSNTDMIVDIQAGHGYPVLGNDQSSYYGGMLTLGFVVNSALSLGFGLDAAYKNRDYFLQSWATNEYKKDPHLTFGGLVAAAVKNEGGNLAWDAEVAYGMEPLFWYDPATDLFNEYNQPIYFEQTLTIALNGNKTFLALKQANDFYIDRSLYYGRAMPCLEQWFGEAFAVRAGGEATLFARDGSADFGWGATGGLTLRLFGFDLDANYTFRMRPSRTLADTVIPESVLFFTLTRNGIFKR